jgi:hypothetical protein
MPGLSHPSKRRRPKHPRPETSLGRVREVAVVAREPVRNELRATWVVIISDVENPLPLSHLYRSAFVEPMEPDNSARSELCPILCPP